MEAENQVRREVEVDTALSNVYGRLGEVNARIDSNKLSLARLVGIRPQYVTRNRQEVRESADELVGMLRAKLDAGEIPRWDEERAERTLTSRDDLLTERAALVAEKKPLDAEFAAKPWSRFFLVQNHGGHIHSTMACSTCRPTTVFAWLPELSGLTERDAVEAYGPLLCSVCFPSAPVEWTVGAEPKGDPDRCPGSGEYPESDPTKAGRRYRACPVCHEVFGVTSTGKLRAHKKPKAQR